MKEQFEKLMYESGLIADGCWGDMDSYDQGAITKFAELIVRECAGVCDDLRDITDYEFEKDMADTCAMAIMKRFGVE